MEKTEAKKSGFCVRNAINLLFMAGFAVFFVHYGMDLIGQLKKAGADAVRLMDVAGAAFSMSGLLAAILVWKTSKNARYRKNIYKSTRFWRYLAYGVVLMIVSSCVFGGDNPRDIAKLMLVGCAATFVVILSNKRIYCNLKRITSLKIVRFADIALFNVVLLLVLAEIGLRVLSLLSASPLLSAPNLKAAKRIQDYKLKPGQLHLGKKANKLGFNDTCLSRDKQAGVYRVAAFTDSFGVETVPYDGIFLTLLEQESGSGGTKVPGVMEKLEVMNFGVDAISPEGYLHLMREYYRQYNSDMALVCIFVGNDITGLPEKTPSTPWLRQDYWYVYFVAKRVFSLAGREVQLEHTGGEISEKEQQSGAEAEEKPTFPREDFLRIERKRLRVCTPKGVDGKLDSKFARLGRIFLQMKAVAKGNMRVVIIPDEFQVNEKLYAEMKDRFSFAEGDFDLGRPQREIAGLCKKAGLKCLDLLPVLRRENDGGNVYHLQDTHWNRRGHRIAAREIASFISD